MDKEFRKDINWFYKYLATTNGIFMINQDTRQPVHMYIDACMTGRAALCQTEVYHIVSTSHLTGAASHLRGRGYQCHGGAQVMDFTGVLHIDSATAVAVFQAERGTVGTCSNRLALSSSGRYVQLTALHSVLSTT